MKFKCFCGNIINATMQFCKGPCRLYRESDYILKIKFFFDMISTKEYLDGRKLVEAFFCEECKRYSVLSGDSTYVFKLCPGETMPFGECEIYHLIDEFENEAILTELDDPQKRNEIIKSDFKLLPKTRMMNISFTEKKAYIENLDGSIETYILEREVKR